MIVEVFPSGPVNTNAILIGCEKTRTGVFIDPSAGSAQKLLDAAEKHHLKIQAIYLTHSHWDHFVDAAYLKQKLRIDVYVHEKDAENLIHPGADRLPTFFDIEGVEPTHLLEDGDKGSIGDLQFVVIHTPGHCPGSVCFYFEKEQVLISGDTLFKGTIGRLDLPTAEPKKMWISLKKLALLPGVTKVYPGHGPTTTIGAETWLSSAENMFG